MRAWERYKEKYLKNLEIREIDTSNNTSNNPKRKPHNQEIGFYFEFPTYRF